MGTDAVKGAVDAMLEPRLDAGSRAWLDERRAEIAGGLSDDRFAQWISLASRYAPRRNLEPDADERSAAEAALPGWNPERWAVLETVRVALVLSRPDLAGPGCVRALDEVFRFADQGELCALYRAIALLPEGERFAARAAEGCRSNMGVVFEAVACDSPYPVRTFDDVAWNHLVMKALFTDAPLWRVYGVDGRLTPELARMALDLADERRSAGRPVPPELWMCLGAHGGDRGMESLERELSSSISDASESHALESNASESNASASSLAGRRGAVLALARAGGRGRVKQIEAECPELAATARAALAGSYDSLAFRTLVEGGL